jgi:hypothetical protein
MDHDRPDSLLIWASGGKPLGVRARNSPTSPHRVLGFWLMNKLSFSKSEMIPTTEELRADLMRGTRVLAHRESFAVLRTGFAVRPATDSQAWPVFAVKTNYS